MDAQAFLVRTTERFGPLFAELDHKQTELRASGVQWPAWCQLPDQLVVDRLSALGLDRKADPVEFESALTAYAWRRSRDVFRFQPPLLQAMTESQVRGLVGVDALSRLPESCVFMETPHVAGAQGVFARLDYERLGDHDNLWVRFLALGQDSVMPFAVRLGLGQSLEQALLHAAINANDPAYAANGAGDVLKDNLHGLVSLLLCLCYARDDLRQQPGGGDARVWLVGRRLASDLREAPSFSGAAWQIVFWSDLSGGGFEWKHPSLGQLPLKPF